MRLTETSRKKMYRLGVSHDNVREGTRAYAKIIDVLGAGRDEMELLQKGGCINKPFIDCDNHPSKDQGEIWILVIGRHHESVGYRWLFVFIYACCWVADGPYRPKVDPDPLHCEVARRMSGVITALNLPKRSAESLMRMARRAVQKEAQQ